MQSAMPASSAAKTPTLDAIQALIANDMKQVNQVILRKVQSDVPLIADLAAHIIQSGGKRLRPALTLACARLCGYEGERHIRLAACVEFIHTATLLHDDVVDESKLRRGAATANDIWGNKSSVLVGDFLFSRSFELMVEDGSLRVLEILSRAAATIAEGEVKQLMTTNDPETTEADYLAVIEAKTAALFAAAGALGAVVSEQPQHEAGLREFGQSLGIAFQLVDDALDYAANQQQLGKTVGDDFREGKITLPIILAYARATEQERAFFHRTLADLNQQEGDLDYAMKILERYDAIGQTFERARGFAEIARRALSAFAPGPIRLALEETVDFCVERSF